MELSNKKYDDLLDSIYSTLPSAKVNAARAINAELVKANWEIGRNIVEFEQQGNEKAEYGSSLLANLANDLKVKFGKGFSRSNLFYIILQCTASIETSYILSTMKALNF